MVFLTNYLYKTRAVFGSQWSGFRVLMNRNTRLLQHTALAYLLYCIFESIVVDGTGFQLRAISVNGGKARTQNGRDARIVGNAKAYEGENAQLGGESLVTFRFYLSVGTQQLVHFRYEIGVYIQESRVEIKIIMACGSLNKIAVFSSV